MNIVPTPADTARNDDLLTSLALMYYRHNDPARALALSLAALQLGPAAPRLVLLIAACFLRTGDAEQAAAALSRFDGEAALLARTPSASERAAARLLRARILFRSGDAEAARAELLAANAGQGAPGT